MDAVRKLAVLAVFVCVAFCLSVAFAESAQLIFDDFSSNTGNWTLTHNWEITGDELKHYHETDPYYGEIRTHAESSYTDYSVRAKLKSADGFPALGLVGRFSSNGTTKFYMVYFSGSYVRLYRYINGYTQLAYSSFSLPTNEWVDTFLRFEGDEIIVFVNGAKKIHIEDTYGSAPNSGKAGFYSRKGDHRFDDFEVIGDDGLGITYQELTSGEPVSTSVKWGYKRYYKVYVPDDDEVVSLTVRTYDADQDIDAYVRETTPVNRYTYHFYSAGATGDEEIRVDSGTSPQLKKDQWYYVMIDGFREFCTYTIEGIVNKRPSASDVTMSLEDAGIFARMRIDYKLTDPNDDDCNFNTADSQVQFSTDQTNWYDATDYGTIEGAASSASGLNHSLSYQPLYWYARIDKGFESGTSYYVRIKPHDGEDYASSYAVSATALYNNPLDGDFDDDFDESSQWTVASGTWDTTGNVYNQTDTTSGYKVSRAGSQSWHNYDVCVDGKYISATDGEKRFGVRLRNNTTWNTFWDFYVEDDGSGWEAKFAYVSGGYRYVYAEHDVTVTSDTWYTFRITFSGDYFTYTFDKQASLRGTLTGARDYGGIALWSRGGTYAFDNCFIDTKGPSDALIAVENGGSEYNFVAKYQQKFYKVTVPPGTKYMTIATTSTSDDIDLYVRQGEDFLPSRTEFDYVSGETSGNETVYVSSPEEGTWYVLVDGYKSSEYKIIVEFDDLTAHDGETIWLYEDTVYEDITIQNGGKIILQPSSRISLFADTITINNGGILTVEGEAEIRAGTMTINTGGIMDGSGKGYPAGQGPGAGLSATAYWEGGGGGCYGGPGGDGGNHANSGSTETYGSMWEPREKGSGGGSALSSGGIGGPGGGSLIILNITGTLTINGMIKANGFPGGTAYCLNEGGGGGSGGGIYIVAKTIIGPTGQHDYSLVQVIGGDGGGATLYTTSAGGGGGGGGRAAVYAWTFQNFDIDDININGGTAGTSGPQYQGTPAENGWPGTRVCATVYSNPGDCEACRVGMEGSMAKIDLPAFPYGECCTDVTDDNLYIGISDVQVSGGVVPSYGLSYCYNHSVTEGMGGMSEGWKHSYYIIIEKVSDEQLVLIKECGRRITYYDHDGDDEFNVLSFHGVKSKVVPATGTEYENHGYSYVCYEENDRRLLFNTVPVGSSDFIRCC